MMLSESDLREVRKLFPHLTQGNLYLNHASTGPLSIRVVEAIHQYLERHAIGEIDTYHHDVVIVEECRQRVARLINSESKERVAFLGNTTDAINVVASGIPWKSGDRILLPSVEFPANVYPYLNQRLNGVEIDFLEASGGCVTPEAVTSRLTPRTRLVALSAIQFLSGYRADLETIGSLCRQRGVIFAVDGIQAVGAVNIDVQRIKIDVLSAGAQKWQLSPQGTGFLYLTEEIQARIQQRSLGWLGVADPWNFHDFGQPLASGARRYEGGSQNMQGLWGMHAALATHLETGMERIEQHLLEITGHLIKRLQEIDGIMLVTPSADAARGGIVTVRCNTAFDATEVYKNLLSRRVTVAIREGLIRYSPHFYNSIDDMNCAADATAECIREHMNS
jgi:selenocysteine lyase/cysteine desulfurase